MRRQKIFNECYYHVYNRGVDKRNIFATEKDYERFICQMIRFNDLEPSRHFSENYLHEGNLVQIIVYCLMPNHFHLLLKQVKKNGISKYLHRLQTGYTMYFNKRHERTGVLLQGTFKCKIIKTNSNLLQLSKYIHSNPTKVIGKNNTNLIQNLRNYRWSSLGEYLDENHEQGVVDDLEPILNQFKTRREYEKFVFDI